MIREANVNDIETIAQINTNVWKTNYKGIIDDDYLKKRTVEEFMKKEKETNLIEDNNKNTFVCEENNVIKGFIIGYKIDKKRDCEIMALYVDVKYQRKGIGTKLIEYMKRYYKENECKKMTIWTLRNLENNTFYRKLGGEIKEEKELNFGNKNYKGIGFIFEL
jgi:N-acetylglutamate synthase-like GNAT family acetyltransferase